MSPYFVDWETLRVAVRIKSEGIGLRKLSSQMRGVSATTLSRFLRGNEVDLATLLQLLDYAEIDIEKIIRRGAKQLPLWG